MNTILLVSYFALWMLVLLLTLALAILARQIGVLHKRLAPSGARMTSVGPAIGEAVPIKTVVDMDGHEIALGGATAIPTLLTFVSSGCSSCAGLAPALRSLWKSERSRLSLVVVGVAGSEEDNRQFVAENHLTDIPFVLSRAIGETYKVLSPPYALVLDTSGTVRAKGIVNRKEHLESLLNAIELNEPSLESYVNKRMVEASLDPMLGTSE
jgi:methylamine dehydrogenase accessory protein MauD